MSDQIHQLIQFSASPHAVYEALMDSKQHGEFTHSEAKISRDVGGIFSAYDGYITGINIELVPDKKIVQDWRAVDWPEGFFSRVIFEISPQGIGTHLDFTHNGFPEGTLEEFRQGWSDNYWDPMKLYFKNLRT